jgi:hypothetical protein
LAANTAPITPISAVTKGSGTIRAVAQPMTTPTVMPMAMIATTRRSKLWR